MNEAIVRYVVTTSPVEGATYWTHLSLAIHADDDAHVRIPQTELARAVRLNVGTLRRCVRELVAAGLLVVVEQPSGWRPALLRLEGAPTARAGPEAGRAVGLSRPRPRRALSGANGDTHLALDLQGQELLPDADASGPSTDPTARGLTQRVWKRRQPPPAQKFIAVMKIAEALLRVGWPASDVEDIMVVVPTISTKWCEAELNKRRGVAPTRAVDTDREGPAVERIKL